MGQGYSLCTWVISIFHEGAHPRHPLSTIQGRSHTSVFPLPPAWPQPSSSLQLPAALSYEAGRAPGPVPSPTPVKHQDRTCSSGNSRGNSIWQEDQGSCPCPAHTVSLRFQESPCRHDSASHVPPTPPCSLSLGSGPHHAPPPITHPTMRGAAIAIPMWGLLYMCARVTLRSDKRTETGVRRAH